MTSLRLLNAGEAAIFRTPAVGRLSCQIHITNRHYWVSRSSQPYARSRIYNKDTYYSQLVKQRNTRNARLCGSWTHRKAREECKGKEANKNPASNAERSFRDHDKQEEASAADEFYRELKQDTVAAYEWYKQAIEKDPYRWIFDPTHKKHAWDPVEWLERHRDMFGKRGSNTNDSTPENSSNASKIPRSSTVTQQKMETEDYIVDLISLRKVPVEQSDSGMASTVSAKQSSVAKPVVHDIPVKRYHTGKDHVSKPSKEAYRDHIRNSSDQNNSAKVDNAHTKSKLSGFASQPWLVKEGFTTNAEAVPRGNPASDSVRNIMVHRIEPSLNRVNKSIVDSRSSLKYPPPEKTTDDVDLLRAADVRAASGHVKTRCQLPSTKTEAQSNALKNSWQAAAKTYSKDLHEAYNEVLEKRKSRLSLRPFDSTSGDSKKHPDVEFKKVKEHYNELQHELDHTRKVLEQARAQFLHSRLNLEADAIKESFDGFETRPRKQTLTGGDNSNSAIAMQKSRQNQRAAGDLAGGDKANRDANLISEIKNIYEQSYGTITPDHRQRNFEEPKLQEFTDIVPEYSLGDPSVLAKSHASETLPPQSPDTFNSQAATSEHNSKTSLRSLLYQSLRDMGVSQTAQKRLEFSLRGISALDEMVAKPGLTSAVNTMSVVNACTEIKIAMEALQKSQTILIEEMRKIQVANNAGKDNPLQEGGEKDMESGHSRREEHTYTYKILALDIGSGEVATATTTSSIKHKTSIPRSAAGILVHLDQPTRYFKNIEKLDAAGYQLVSGSRTMLVYRRKVGQDNIKAEAVIKSSTPLREESVFSGSLNSQDRLLRSYQLAHRRARSDIEKNGFSNVVEPSANDEPSHSEPKEQQSSKFYRSFTSRAGTVILAVSVCYAIGLLQNIRAQREIEEGERRRQKEAEMRSIIERRNDWRWF